MSNDSKVYISIDKVKEIREALAGDLEYLKRQLTKDIDEAKTKIEKLFELMITELVDDSKKGDNIHTRYGENIKKAPSEGASYEKDMYLSSSWELRYEKSTKEMHKSDIQYEELLRKAAELTNTDPENLRGMSEEGLKQIIWEFGKSKDRKLYPNYYSSSKEPITDRQLRYLKALYRKLGMEFPRHLESVSKATAHALITELEKKVHAKGD